MKVFCSECLEYMKYSGEGKGPQFECAKCHKKVEVEEETDEEMEEALR